MRQLSLDIVELRARGYADPEFRAMATGGISALWRNETALLNLSTVTKASSADGSAALLEQCPDAVLDMHATIAVNFLARAH